MKSNEIDVLLHEIREQLAEEYRPASDEELAAEAREFAAAYGLKTAPAPSRKTKP